MDGVCCGKKCDGECESCDISGALGTCTPHAAGSDPEAECTGKGVVGDTCAGNCNGASACEFPGAEKSCGQGTCDGSTLIGSVCGGDGSCTTGNVECAPFGCATGACTSECKTDAECAADAWCNGSSCETKKPNGEKCGGDSQCSSGICAGTSCCATTCAAPNTCDTGECSCNGVVCSAGATCETWYADQDGDGFPAPSTLDKVSCSNQAPVTTGITYHPAKGAKLDCFDSNMNAFPGQTQFFSDHRGDGSFDYDCTGSVDKKFKEVSSVETCKDCGVSYLWSTSCSKCTSGGSKLGAGYQCNTCGPAVWSAFKGPVACGATGVFGTCTTEASSCGPLTESKTTGQQQCR